MSRNSSFYATIGEKVIFQINWKDYFNVDETILYLIKKNNLTSTIPSNGVNNYSLEFNGLGAFYWLYTKLCETLDWQYWCIINSMNHSPQDAAATWGYILNAIDRFLKTPYDGEIKIKYTSND